jgi:hypothetical protein
MAAIFVSKLRYIQLVKFTKFSKKVYFLDIRVNSPKSNKLLFHFEFKFIPY